MSNPPGEVTRLLAELRLGNKDALGKLMPLVYDELQGLARRYALNERTGHTIQPTALVHEAYLRLVGQDRADWRNRAQFIGVAARMMRRVLADYARQHTAGKRPGDAARVDIDGLDFEARALPVEEILAVDHALERLAVLDPRQGRVVELRYFGGLTVEEAAQTLGISPRTVRRDWAMAAAWLRSELSGRGIA